jgi:hypothetical protein
MADEPTLLTAAVTPTEPVTAAETVAVEAPAQNVEQAAAVEDWRPESLRGEKTLEKYKSPEDAYKALVEAQKLIGKKADPLAPPAEDAPQEEKDAFSAKLRELRGVPAEDKVAEAYAVEVPEDAPEGYALSPELLGAFQGLAHKAGLAPAEFKELAAGYMAMEVQAIAAARQEAKVRQEKAETALVKEWQAADLVPKEQFSNALKAAQALGLVSKDGKESILGHLGNNTALIKALASEVYPLVAEGKLKGGATASQEPAYTPQEAMGKLRAMQADPRYRDSMKRDPDYVREVDAFAEKFGRLIRRGA